MRRRPPLLAKRSVIPAARLRVQIRVCPISLIEQALDELAEFRIRCDGSVDISNYLLKLRVVEHVRTEFGDQDTFDDDTRQARSIAQTGCAQFPEATNELFIE